MSQTINTYNAYGQLLTSKEYKNSTESILTTYVYNNLRQLTSKTIDGVTESYTYDNMFRLKTVTDGNGNTTTFTYDVMGRQDTVTNPDGTTIDNDYDDRNNILIATNENGVKTRYTYDSLGNIKETEITDDSGAYSTIAIYEYDSKMRLSRETDAKGTPTTYVYDNLDRVTEKRTLSTAGTELYREGYLYQDGLDSNTSKVTKTVYGETNAPNIVATTYMDKYGRLSKQGKYTGATASTEVFDTFTYGDYLGNQTQARNELNQTTKFDYDYAGRATKVTNPDNTTVQTAYDWLGRKTSVTDPKGSVSTYTYYDTGLLKEEKIPFEGSYFTTKRYIYDSNGNQKGQEISNNKPGSAAAFNKTEYDYDSRNRLEEVRTFDNNTVESYTGYTYDGVGNQLPMTTANGTQTTSYEYDSQNRLTKLTDPLNQYESYKYDKNGNLTEKTYRSGNRTVNAYDALNRLTDVSVYNSANVKAKEFIKSTYAKTGAKLTEQNENLTTTFVYDNLGRVISQKESNNIDKAYTYDAMDNRKTFILKQNDATKTNQSYNYDNMNRLTEVLDGATIQAKYTYDANGNRATLAYPTSGLTTTYAYNLANLVKTLTNQKGTSTLSKFDYTYYLDGNQESKTDSTGKKTTYLYDDLGRLTEEKETASGKTLTKAYEYDAAGNRDVMRVSGTETYTMDYTYDKNNRLKTEIKDKGLTIETAEYQYDKNGNQISKTTFYVGGSVGGEAVGVYLLGSKLPMPREDYTVELNEFDVFNRLVKVQNDEGTSLYCYKSDGLRISKDVNGALVTHVWDGDQIVLDFGAVNDVYLRGSNLIKSNNQGFYLYNAHGDVVQRTNVSGTLAKSYVYDAFGVEENIDDADSNPFKYAGEYTDFETGSIYLRNRYYDPATSRMYSEDPIRDGLNWYTYAYNNPISFIDPTGLVGESIFSYAFDLGFTMNLINEENFAVFFNTQGEYYYWGSVYAIPLDDNTRLTDMQQKANAAYIFTSLRNAGWSDEAVAGLLGNINQESWFNPGVWQSIKNGIYDDTLGYGLVQWDDGSRFLNAANLTINAANDLARNNPQELMDLQLEFLIASSQPGQGEWIQKNAISSYNAPYQMTFADFIIATNRPNVSAEDLAGELALVFHAHYERSADDAKRQQNSIDFAKSWYRYFS